MTRPDFPPIYLRGEEDQEEEKEEEKMRLPALLCLLWAAAGPAAAADRSCTDLRQFYTSKGFTLGGVPQAEISGELRRHQWNERILYLLHIDLL